MQQIANNRSALVAEMERIQQVKQLPKRAQRRFEGATVDRLTASWLASSAAIDQELRGSLDLLRRRSRDLFKNNEYAAKFGRMVSNNVVGPDGFTLQARVVDNNGAPDRGANIAIEKAFWRWMRPGNCEVTGKLAFNDLLRLMVLCLARDGEVLLRRVRDKKRGEFGYQLQIIDIDRLDTNYNREASGNANAIIMGVEVDSFRTPVAYHIFTSNFVGGTGRKRDRVSADEMFHRFIPIEAEQTRGVPWIHAAMRRMNDLNGYREAAVIAARIGASKMGFFTSPNGEPPENDGQDADGNFISQASPGTFDVLPNGYSFESFNPDYPHDQFDSFCKEALRGIASGIGVAYNALGNDLEGVNFSSMRGGVLDERDSWMVVQNWLVGTTLTFIHEEFIEAALIGGKISLANGSLLPAQKLAKFREHVWQPRRWSWVDPKKDIEASILAIEANLASPQQIAAQQGRDIEDVLDDIAAFQLMLKEKNITQKAAPGKKELPEEKAKARDSALLDTMRLFVNEFRAQPQNPTQLTIKQEPVTVHLAQAEHHFHITQDRADNPAPIVNVTVEPTPIEIRVEPTPVTVNVEPAEVNVALEATLPTPEIKVELPARKTETTIARDSSGRITKTTQLETDA